MYAGCASRNNVLFSSANCVKIAQEAAHRFCPARFLNICFFEGEISHEIERKKSDCRKVVNVNEGAVNAIVCMEIAGGHRISATISMNAVKELELAVGKEAVAVIKATSVMFGVEE